MRDPGVETAAARAFGLMFHYFHDGVAYPAAQGSLSAERLDCIIGELRASGRLVDALEWAELSDRNELRDQVCVTFDDGLRSQVDVALPVLRRHGVTAFWFPQSGIFTGEPGTLEAFRRFRNEMFATLDDFYAAFFERVGAGAASPRSHDEDFGMPGDYLQEFPFYSRNDRRFRYLRDHALRPDEYFAAMSELVRSQGTSIEELSEGLFMTSDCVRDLTNTGHVVGLHSHSHPILLGQRPVDEQRREYERNHAVLTAILGARPYTVAHPHNSYSDETLRILAGLGISLGFRSNMAKSTSAKLERPRTDSADLVRADVASASSHHRSATGR